MSHTLAATATAAVVLTGYLVACWMWPFAACMRCKGEGKFKSPWGGSWRKCRRCRGSGERLRVGRRLWNAWAKTLSKGTKS